MTSVYKCNYQDSRQQIVMTTHTVFHGQPHSVSCKTSFTEPCKTSKTANLLLKLANLTDSSLLCCQKKALVLNPHCCTSPKRLGQAQHPVRWQPVRTRGACSIRSLASAFMPNVPRSQQTGTQHTQQGQLHQVQKHSPRGQLHQMQKLVMCEQGVVLALTQRIAGSDLQAHAAMARTVTEEATDKAQGGCKNEPQGDETKDDTNVLLSSQYWRKPVPRLLRQGSLLGSSPNDNGQLLVQKLPLHVAGRQLHCTLQDLCHKGML